MAKEKKTVKKEVKETIETSTFSVEIENGTEFMVEKQNGKVISKSEI